MILVAKQVRQTIYAPRDVPHQDGANKHTPHHHACGEIQRAVPIQPDAANGKRRGEEQHALRNIKPQGTGWILFQPHVERILQDIFGVALVIAPLMQLTVVQKQPTHVAPKKSDKRGMRILVFVAVHMVLAMS